MPCQPNALCSLAVMSWQRPNIGSRVTREGHARFWERPVVKFLRATRQCKDALHPASPLTHVHHAVAGERRNLALGETELGEYRLGLCAEPLRRQANGCCLTVVAHGMIDQRDRRAAFA